MDYKKLYEQTLAENKELKHKLDCAEVDLEEHTNKVCDLKENQLTEESAINYVYEHTDSYEDWVKGSSVYQDHHEELKKELNEVSKKNNAKSDIIRNMMDKILKDVNLDDGFHIGREWGNKYIDEWNKIVDEEFKEVVKDINYLNYECEDFRLTTRNGFQFDFETIEEEEKED